MCALNFEKCLDLSLSLSLCFNQGVLEQSLPFLILPICWDTGLPSASYPKAEQLISWTWWLECIWT